MNLEKRIRAAMADHEHEAPTSAEFVPMISTPRRRTNWLPVAAAAAAVLAVAGTVAAIRYAGDGRDSAAPVPVVLECPQTVASGGPNVESVPARPDGVDGTHRLVPLQTPSRALVCAYEHPPAGGSTAGRADRVALTGAAELGGNLSRLTDALAWLPRTPPDLGYACATYAAPTDGDAYLIGLDYPDGTIWVSAPGNHCSGASNGSFQTQTNLRAFAAAAYAAHEVVPRTASTPPTHQTACEVANFGRLGQEKEMVPDEPESATICTVPTLKPSSSTEHQVADPRSLVTALNSLRTVPSTSTCSGLGNDVFTYELLFRYAAGPPVLVRVMPDCRPPVDNYSLQADHAGPVVALLEHLLTHK